MCLDVGLWCRSWQQMLCGAPPLPDFRGCRSWSCAHARKSANDGIERPSGVFSMQFWCSNCLAGSMRVWARLAVSASGIARRWWGRKEFPHLPRLAVPGAGVCGGPCAVRTTAAGVAGGTASPAEDTPARSVDVVGQESFTSDYTCRVNCHSAPSSLGLHRSFVFLKPASLEMSLRASGFAAAASVRSRPLAGALAA